METDRSLLEAARRMDQRALVTIFDRYAVELYNYVLRLFYDPNEADNVVGEVFSNFLDQLSNGRDTRSDLRSHLYKLTYSLIAEGPQFSQRESALEFAILQPDKGNGQHPAIEDSENKLLLEKVLLAIKNHMTKEQRHVIVLRFLEGFSLRETAEIIGKNVSNVRALQNRGIANVRKVLNQEVML